MQDNGGTANGGVDLDASPNTITFNVTAVNDAPAGADKTITTLEDTAVTLATADFGFTDPSDTPADALLDVKIASLPTNGTLAYDGTAITAAQVTSGFFVTAADIAAGKLTFTPAANANGPAYANFTFQVRDNGGTADGGIDLDASANTITFNVTSVNDAPVINLDPDNSGGGANDGNRTVVFTENGLTVGSGPVRIADVDVGITDPDASALTSLTITASGLADGAAEQVIFDGGSTSVREFALDADKSTTASIGGVTWSIAYTASTGEFAITKSGGGTFTTAQAQTLLATALYNHSSEVPTSGGRTFAFTATDNGGATSVAATSVVTVTPQNDRAWFNPDPDGSLGVEGHASRYELIRLTASGTNYTGVLSDGNLVTVAGNIAGVNGRAISEPTTIVEYGDNSPATFVGMTPSGTVTLTFPGGVAPEGTLIVLTDVDGGTETVQISSSGGRSPVLIDRVEATVGATSTFPYWSPLTGRATGISLNTNEFTFLDISGLSDITLTAGTVVNFDFGLMRLNDASVTHTFVEDGPSVPLVDADAGLSSLGENDVTSLTIAVANIVDGASEVVTIAGESFELDTSSTVTGVAVGSATIDIAYDAGAGTFSITNAAGAGVAIAFADWNLLVRGMTYENTSQDPTGGVGTNRTFTYRFEDTAGLASRAVVSTIVVAPVNDAPVDGDETNSITEDTTLTVADGTTGDLLENTTDVDGGTPTITGYTIAGMTGTQTVGSAVSVTSGATTVGTLTINADGSYSFVPAANYTGAIPLVTYTVSDGARRHRYIDARAVHGRGQRRPRRRRQDHHDAGRHRHHARGSRLRLHRSDDSPPTVRQHRHRHIAGLGLADAGRNRRHHGSIDLRRRHRRRQARVDTRPRHQRHRARQLHLPGAGRRRCAERWHRPRCLRQHDHLRRDPGQRRAGEHGSRRADNAGGHRSRLQRNQQQRHHDCGHRYGSFRLDDVDGRQRHADARLARWRDGLGRRHRHRDDHRHARRHQRGPRRPRLQSNARLQRRGADVRDDNGWRGLREQHDRDHRYSVVDIAGDSVTTNEDAAVTINLLTNDSFEGSSPAINAVTQPAHGTVSIGTGGTVTYTPDPDFNGPDSFTYTVTSGGVTETATVNVTVDPVNDAPITTVPPGQSINEDSPLGFSASNGNAITLFDIDGDTLTVTLSATNGMLTLGSTAGVTFSGNGTGTVTVSGTAAAITAALDGLSFAPTPDYNGTAGITVTTTDGAVTASQTIGIGVTPVVDIVADAIGTSEDTPVTFNALTNDSFEAANETVTALTQGASGTVSFLADGSITYTPDANFHGSDTFTYTVASSGVTESTTVTVNVGDVNDIPTTVGLADRSNLDNQTVSLDTSVFFADADNDPLSYTISGLPAGLTYNPSTGEISGTIDKSASIGGLLGDGVYAVVVTASDGFPGGTASATFTWSISNPPPTAVDDTSTTGEDQPVTIDVLGNDIDPDLDPLTVTNATAGHGTVTINPDGSIVYTPEADFNGTDTIVYEISDGNGGVSTAELSVIVTAVNDAPVATALTPISTVDSAPLTLDTAAAFTDVDADTLTYTAAACPPVSRSIRTPA